MYLGLISDLDGGQLSVGDPRDDVFLNGVLMPIVTQTFIKFVLGRKLIEPFLQKCRKVFVFDLG